MRITRYGTNKRLSYDLQISQPTPQQKQLEIDLETAEEREKDLKVQYNSLQEQLVETKESVSQTSTIFNQDLQKAIVSLVFFQIVQK